MNEEYEDLEVILEHVPSSPCNKESSSTSKVPKDLSESNTKKEIAKANESEILLEDNENKEESIKCDSEATQDVAGDGKRPKRAAAVQSNRITDFFFSLIISIN